MTQKAQIHAKVLNICVNLCFLRHSRSSAKSCF